MTASQSNPVDILFSQVSNLYVGLEDFTHEGSVESLLEVLAQLRDFQMSMSSFGRSAVAVLRENDVPWAEIAASMGVSREDALEQFRRHEGQFGLAERHLAAMLGANGTVDQSALVRGNVYTRNMLRELFEINDATLNNGVFHLKDRREVWLFVTENKSADREQYVDKLADDSLYWQGQRMGRTDPLIIDHKHAGEAIMVFYRRAKYEFEGAGFRYEGAFEYVSHSGGPPTNFLLRRVTPYRGHRLEP